MSIYQSEPDEQGFGVEVHVGKGLPGFDIVGQAPERVALIRRHVVEMLADKLLSLPAKRVTVNVIGPWRPNIAVAQAIYDGLRKLAGS